MQDIVSVDINKLLLDSLQGCITMCIVSYLWHSLGWAVDGIELKLGFSCLVAITNDVHSIRDHSPTITRLKFNTKISAKIIKIIIYK